jgi:hypothetical protein
MDASVRERKQRHDGKAHPRMKPVLETVVERDRRGDTELCRTRQLRRWLLAKGAGQFHNLLELCPPRCLSARNESDREPADYGIDPGLIQRQPQDGAEDGGSLHAPAVGGIAKRRQCREGSDGDQQRAKRDAARVCHDNHEECDKVIGQRQCQHPYPQARARRRDQGQHAQCERCIGGHGGSPTALSRPARVHRQVERYRHDHAAEGGHHRDRRPPTFSQFSEIQLSLGLKADREEVERHQPVVQPVAQVLGCDQSA